MEAFAEASSAGSAAVFSVIALYPVNKVKIRMQAMRRASMTGSVEKPRKATFLSCLLDMIKEEGLLSLYKGIGGAMSRGFYNNFVFYYAFSALKVIFQRDKGLNPTMLKSMLHGICAGMVVQLVMSPIDTAMTRVMLAKKGEGKASFRANVMEIYRESGLGGFWAGIAPMLMLTMNPGITTTVRNYFTRGRVLTPRQNFWIGAISKCIASICTYPMVVAKVKMQMRQRAASLKVDIKSELGKRERRRSSVSLEPEEKEAVSKVQAQADKEEKKEKEAVKAPSLVSTVSKMVAEGGVGSLYKGCQVHISQAMAKEAILNSFKAEINKTVMNLLLGPQTATA